MTTHLENFIAHVRDAASNESFIHHPWFVEYHIEIVERIAFELCDIYKDADRSFVQLLVWLHDYGKIRDFDNQYHATESFGFPALVAAGYSEEDSKNAIDAIRQVDSADREKIEGASIEVQIVSSADGLSHHVGPFFHLWFWENSDKDYEELMSSNINKTNKDWEKKIVLPEAIEAVRERRAMILEMGGEIPGRILG